MRHHRKTIAAWAITSAALILLLQILVGCGRKAPPTVPDQSPLVPVKDLQANLTNGKVRLTWSHLPDNVAVVGYIVLRAQSALAKPECPQCPQVFQKVATVPVRRVLRDTEADMEFVQDVMEGFRYTFKVRPYTSSTNRGPDSGLVVITFYSKNK
jgi:predicted small lipoprotein YifL